MERILRDQGFTLIAGVDEVGVGSLAGPVLAAAVILPAKIKVKGIDDSKKLTAKKRNELFHEITGAAVSIGIGIVDWETIRPDKYPESLASRHAGSGRRAGTEAGIPAD